MNRRGFLAAAGGLGLAALAPDAAWSRFESLPERLTSAPGSIFGWPEDRIRHAESFTVAQAGDPTHPAYDRALALYPATRALSRAQIELHRALALVIGGDVPAGISHASAALTTVPAQHMGQLAVRVAQDVLHAVPAADARRGYVSDYAGRLAEAGAAR